MQTNNRQFKIAVTFLTGYKGSFDVRVNKFHFAKSITDNGDSVQITIPQVSYELQ